MRQKSSISRAVGAARAALVMPLLGLLLSAHGCALSNVNATDCTGDTQCANAFGPGSKCQAGFCTDPVKCTTGHDCRRDAGGGVCVNGTCSATFPTDPACNTVMEPADLLKQPAYGPDAPLVFGGIYSLEADHDLALTKAIRLAVRDINKSGGLDNGQKVGVVFCDNGGKGNTATGDARNKLDAHAVDYLAGTLGVPVIIGPLSSSDSIQLVGELKAKTLPTVVISASATSPALTMLDDRLHPNDPYGLFWRTCPSDQLQSQVLATQVIGKDTTISTVTVIYINDVYGQGLATGFQTDFSPKMANLVPYEDTVPDDPTQLGGLIDAADSMNGDAVLLIALQGSTAIKILEATAGKAIATKPWFFTDGSQDTALLDPTLPAAVQTILKGAKGTAPADPAGQVYDVFNTDLQTQFQISGTSVSFLAHAYDATYVGAFGVAYAARNGTKYDGLDVAAGMAMLSDQTATLVNVGQLGWPGGKSSLVSGKAINIQGTSGPLDFDASTGEAPGAIAVWGIAPDLSKFTTIQVVQPM